MESNSEDEVMEEEDEEAQDKAHKPSSSMLPGAVSSKPIGSAAGSIKGEDVGSDPDGDDDNNAGIPTIKELVQELLDKLRPKDIHGFFQEPVPADVPMYYELIKNPMDFSTMQSKNTNDRYDTIEQFKDDFKLMITNCKTFNRTDSIFHTEANRIWKSAQRMIDRVIRRYKRLTEPVSAVIPAIDDEEFRKQNGELEGSRFVHGRELRERKPPLSIMQKRGSRDGSAIATVESQKNDTAAAIAASLAQLSSTNWVKNRRGGRGRGRGSRGGRFSRSSGFRRRRAFFTEKEFPWIPTEYIDAEEHSWLDSIDDVLQQRLVSNLKTDSRDGLIGFGGFGPKRRRRVLDGVIPRKSVSLMDHVYGLRKASEMEMARRSRSGEMLPMQFPRMHDINGVPSTAPVSTANKVSGRGNLERFTEGIQMHSYTIQKLGSLDGYHVLQPRSKCEHPFELSVSKEVMALIPGMEMYGIDVDFVQNYVDQGTIPKQV